ncbi:Hpt domain-containing protein [Sulfurovum sp. TSL1]|uniref:Hpt domain-containing protein n=1 Tax=Sulfurovum sp. TSL1 TaxID=2826994 RepID=UPI001CC6B808|nr:Hpt domain-containing protein [Sulfurovum sp. TSL1]GIT98409.1 hypothetical protein TSL1_12300 [Sulfurovum sp. TSL1]
MYYILNETNQIIAADKNLLELCGLSHIDALSLNIALGDTKFDLSETKITITTDQNEKTFPVSKTSLSSMLGHITLVEIQAEEEKAEENDLSVLTLDDTVENIAPLDREETGEEKEVAVEDSERFDLVMEEETESIAPLDTEEPSKEPEVAIEDNELFDLVMEEETQSSIETVEEPLDIMTEDTDILDLGLSDREDEVIMEKPEAEDTAEILIDLDKVCQQIGVSHEDYNTFLNEYIDTALELETDLQSEESATRSNAVATLSHLGEVLQLPVIGDLLKRIDAAPAGEQKATVESFYTALSRITKSPSSQAEPEMDLFDTQKETELDLFDVEEKESKPEVMINEKGFGTISLEGIKPIHFDFQLEEAANDLSLPVELIEEFVNDFIEQCHSETKNMLKAYEEGDLDAIQKIGHLLKGAASNLRINPLADTLYKIQFCEDSSDLEALIKDYWGHFLSFEIQINALAK